MITLDNANWGNRREAIAAFDWYGSLSISERQAWVDAATYEQTGTLGKVLLISTEHLILTRDSEFNRAAMRDLTLRLLTKSLAEGWY